ncbi:ATP-binding protein [Psychrobium sp. 1_MG-2023]|uniref:ATP-binding protein n=1 Tax=Psychrobium sp. 1_MG-2023 TaxID=3062624 RepID=UPI000C32869A|nr:ATP-binding protein [Psychrobium sp. 1_MG-2023]MDP2561148.1 ATP-binding protein [Psychrobium sp. 1_MG-2023]PKF55123.1 hypothetical protein CW748_14260 [Alteromonadales bacterium alter-6D02]
MSHFKIKPRQQIPIIFCLFILVVIIGFVSGKTFKLSQLSEELTVQSTVFKIQLKKDLGRFANVATVFSDNSNFIEFLNQNKTSKQVERINRQLAEIAKAANALNVYLLTPSGDVVASSNWLDSDSFIGQNFAFRQYIKDAIIHQRGFELALGAVSGKRGGYFSTAVMSQDRIVGILVVKADLARLEVSDSLALLGSQVDFIVQDQHEVIFLSNQPSWQLKRLQQTDPLVNKVTTSQQTLKLLNINVSRFWSTLGFRLWQFEPEAINQLVHIDSFSDYPWKIKLFTPADVSTRYGVGVALMFGVSFLALVAFMLFYRERQKNIKQLELSHLKLTKQVARRTQDLTEINKQLMLEIQQRDLAQQKLESAQAQVVQTTKLAVIGQLSSSINHELSQPIAALSSYLQTTQKIIEKQRYSYLPDNLNHMMHTVERLIAIVGQFKSFSRQHSQTLSMVNVSQLINDTLVIIGPHIKQHRVNIVIDNALPSSQVMVEPVQLEQVLINLLTNAVDAVAEVNAGEIQLAVNYCEKQIEISIIDNGEGIEPHYLNQIFEPFFTTKKQNGLGLGLSISRQIIESFNGQLIVESNERQGATFRIRLPIAEYKSV